MRQLNRNIALFFLIAAGLSCNNQKIEYIRFNCFGNTFVLFGDFKKITDSLAKKNISLEYNDSFSGEEQGVKMYSYQEKKDSIVMLNNLYFESNKLKGISINFTSLEIQNEIIFLTRIREGIASCASMKSEIYRVDTSINKANPLESASGQVFHLKVYDRLMHRKVPFVF